MPGNAYLDMEYGLNCPVCSPGHHQVFVSVTRAKRRPKLADKRRGRSTYTASVPKWEWPTQSLVHGRKL